MNIQKFQPGGQVGYVLFVDHSGEEGGNINYLTYIEKFQKGKTLPTFNPSEKKEDPGIAVISSYTQKANDATWGNSSQQLIANAKKYGFKSMAEVRAFQQANKLGSDGKIDTNGKAMKFLEANPNLQPNSSGNGNWFSSKAKNIWQDLFKSDDLNPIDSIYQNTNYQLMFSDNNTHNSATLKIWNYVQNQDLHRSHLSKSAINGYEPLLIATTFYNKPSQKEVERQFKEKGYAEWDLNRQNSGGKYPYQAIFNGRSTDNNGNNVADSTVWKTLGQYTARLYPDGTLKIIDDYNFDDYEIQGDKNYLQKHGFDISNIGNENIFAKYNNASKAAGARNMFDAFGKVITGRTGELNTEMASYYLTASAKDPEKRNSKVDWTYKPSDYLPILQ